MHTGRNCGRRLRRSRSDSSTSSSSGASGSAGGGSGGRWRLGDVTKNTITHVVDKTCCHCPKFIKTIDVIVARGSLRVRRRCYLT